MVPRVNIVISRFDDVTILTPRLDSTGSELNPFQFSRRSSGFRTLPRHFTTVSTMQPSTETGPRRIQRETFGDCSQDPTTPRGEIIPPSPSKLPKPLFSKSTLHERERGKRTARRPFTRVGSL
jgi:hypothetical protein